VVEDIHSGEHTAIESDLILGFAPTYRVAWTSTGGSIRLVENDQGEWVPGPTYYDNTSPWSGGHPSVALDHVRGMFFSNRRVELPEDGPDVLHIAPTALAILGVDVPPEMDLEPLRFVSN